MSTKQLDTVSLEFFYKENKREADEVEYIASESFTDGEGRPVPWKLRPVTADEESRIRESCTETKVDKRTGVINEIFHDQKYTVALTCQGVVFPDLMNSNLQSSYGARGASSLLKKMLNAGELQSLALKVIEVSGLDDIENQKVDNEMMADMAKNS